MRKSEIHHRSTKVARALPLSVVLISGIFVSASGAEDSITFTAQEMCAVSTPESSRTEGAIMTGSPDTNVLEKNETPAQATKAPAPVAVVQLLDVQILPGRIR